MRKIAIYCRVSTDEQAKNKEGSLTSQLQRLRLKVDEKNRNYKKDKWGKVVKVYEDKACSGKSADRPEFQKMLNDIRSKRIDTVMVTELSRLSRSVTDFLNFIKELENCGCDFICPQYDFDTTSPAGKVFMTIIMALAQFERELVAERTKNNLHARALRGLSNGGSLILGYDKDTKQSGRLIVNDEEASTVKEIFKSYLKADGLAEVARNLNQRGFKNKAWMSKRGRPQGGKPFCVHSIRRILTNYGYIGKREVNKLKKGLSQSKLKSEERYTMVDATWPAIIDSAIFEKVQAKLKANKRSYAKAYYDFLFSGLLACDECGVSLCGQSSLGRGHRYFYYTHAKKSKCEIQRYDAEKLEGLVKRNLFSLLNNEALNKQFVEALILQDKEQHKEQHKGTKSLLEVQKRKVESLKQETKSLVQLVSKNSLAKETNSILTQIQQNEKYFAQIEEERQSLEEALVEEERQIIDRDFIFSRIDKLRRDGFRKAKLSKKKAFLRELITGIRISPKNILRLDFRVSEYCSDEVKKTFDKQEGHIFPFHKHDRSLESSFSKGDSSEVG